MPTYEYECSSCGKRHEVFQSMSDLPLTTCPSCGQRVKRRIHGGTGVIFKGQGFYKNDSRSGSGKSSSSSSSSTSEKSDSSSSSSDSTSS